MTPDQIDAAAVIQQVAEQMLDGSEDRHGTSRRWNASYIRRQGRRLKDALERLTAPPAFHHGYQAGYDGMSRDINPHDPGEDREAWFDGWDHWAQKQQEIA